MKIVIVFNYYYYCLSKVAHYALCSRGDCVFLLPIGNLVLTSNKKKIQPNFILSVLFSGRCTLF